jgi:prepilin signal peptidase PulO-like enzyme (type II secretory pathway)
LSIGAQKQMNQFILYLLLFFFGTLWGSFFYTLSRRYRNKKYLTNFLKIFYEPSHCINCEKKINPIYLIPIFGYILTLGKCKNCNKRISFSYPLFEMIFGLLPILVYNKFGFSIYSFCIFLLLCIALTISLIDFHTLTIPDSLIIAFLAISIYPIIFHEAYIENLYGFILMTFIFLTIIIIFPGGFGGGDLKLASCIGLFAGFTQAIIILETSLITGSILGITYGIITKKGLKSAIPFAPFLTFGLFIAIFYGRQILIFYHNILY